MIFNKKHMPLQYWTGLHYHLWITIWSPNLLSDRSLQIRVDCRVWIYATCSLLICALCSLLILICKLWCRLAKYKYQRFIIKKKWVPWRRKTDCNKLWYALHSWKRRFIKCWHYYTRHFSILAGLSRFPMSPLDGNIQRQVTYDAFVQGNLIKYCMSCTCFIFCKWILWCMYDRWQR